MIKPLRGMKDILFEDALKFEYFIKTASNIVRNYGYSYIETPILEETALFKRSVGDSSDIVNKEMYQFIDKGGRDVCLRPEGTAGVVRAFISNKLDRTQKGYRFFYYGPMFRYERPQKGRLREFHQFGCESFGESSVYEDYTIIEMISKIFDALNIGYKLEINSLGCSECMPSYRDSLVKYLDNKRDKLCTDCNNRINTNPIRVLDCKVESCKQELIDAPKITDNLCENCQRDFEKLQELLTQNGIEFSVNKNLVRGLDYYNKTAFEFVSSEIGAQSAIAGGGRYDKLVEYLDGKPTPAVGFAIGIERVLDLIKLPKLESNLIYLGALDDEYVPNLLSIAKDLREKQEVFIEYKSKKMANHLKSAAKMDALYCGIIGENEAKEGLIWVKNLNTQEQKVIKIEQLINI